MSGYYNDKLAAERLRRAYDLAPLRVRQYLDAEISLALGKIGTDDLVLELGCGYGRILERLRLKTERVVGIDLSLSSLKMAQSNAASVAGCCLAQMNAAALGLRDDSFDFVLCLQNGISAFHIDPVTLISECIRVAKNRGTVLLSSYAARFWNDRLDWFRVQSQHGLIGEIDWSQTGDGKIVCRDGFTARTCGPDDFAGLLARFDYPYWVYEIDGSSVFCEISVIRAGK